MLKLRRREWLYRNVNVTVDHSTFQEIGRRIDLSAGHNHSVAVGRHFVAGQRSLDIAPRLGASFLEALSCIFVGTQLLPLGQHDSVGVPLLIDENFNRFLKNKVRALSHRIYLEGEDAMP
jgi:hypothetical protein